VFRRDQRATTRPATVTGQASDGRAAPASAGSSEGSENAAAWLVVEGTAPGAGSASPGGPPEAMWSLRPGLTPVGREPALVGAGLVLDAAELAPLHALLFHRDGHTWFVDLQSGSGSWVNDQRLPPFTGRELRDRDLLRLGPLALRFRAVARAAGD